MLPNYVRVILNSLYVISLYMYMFRPGDRSFVSSTQSERLYIMEK